jgi:hypothetical protein
MNKKDDRKETIELLTEPATEEPAATEPTPDVVFSWLNIVSDIRITKEQINQALLEADITEPGHVFTKPNELNGAFLTLIREAMKDLKRKVKEITING